MGALRTAQGCSGYIGALQIATLESPPGLVIADEIDEDTYPALVEKLGELAWAVTRIMLTCPQSDIAIWPGCGQSSGQSPQDGR